MVQPSDFVLDRVEVEKNVAHLLVRRVIIRLTRVLLVFGVDFASDLATTSDLRCHGVLLDVFGGGLAA